MSPARPLDRRPESPIRALAAGPTFRSSYFPRFGSGAHVPATVEVDDPESFGTRTRLHVELVQLIQVVEGVEHRLVHHRDREVPGARQSSANRSVT